MKSLSQIIAAMLVAVFFAGSVSAQVVENRDGIKLRSDVKPYTLDDKRDQEILPDQCEAIHTDIIQNRKAAKAVQFYALGDSDGLTHVWEFGDGSKSGAANPLHIYEKSGRYMVRLTLVSKCGLASVQVAEVIIQPGMLNDGMQ